MAADIAGYAELQREMYSDGEVTYPFVATYQNEGDLSRRKLQDIFKKYPNNINVFGDYHNCDLQYWGLPQLFIGKAFIPVPTPSTCVRFLAFAPYTRRSP